ALVTQATRDRTARASTFPVNHRRVSTRARFRGKNCEENIDDCPRNLCQNGATCVDDVNRYSCVCPPTYTGELCERDIDECALRPSVCLNGGTCSNSVGGFSCICVNGWTGPDCSLNIDDCAGAACFNGATCIDRVGSPCEHDGLCVNTPGSFACNCTQGFTGPRCETNVNECESLPCQNDGSCLDDPGTFRCVCMP
ncbi:hypothetical protein B566_EDAN016083, partial [Ephemera danica]